jgi:hypothetical protein
VVSGVTEVDVRGETDLTKALTKLLLEGQQTSAGQSGNHGQINLKAVVALVNPVKYVWLTKVYFFYG